MPLFLHLFSFIHYATEQGRSHHTQFMYCLMRLGQVDVRVESVVFQSLYHKAVDWLVFIAWNRWSSGYSQQRKFFWPSSPAVTRTCDQHIRGSNRAVSESQPAYLRQLIIQTDHILQLDSAVTDSLPRGSVVRPFQPYFPITQPGSSTATPPYQWRRLRNNGGGSVPMEAAPYQWRRSRTNGGGSVPMEAAFSLTLQSYRNKFCGKKGQHFIR